MFRARRRTFVSLRGKNKHLLLYCVKVVFALNILSILRNEAISMLGAVLLILSKAKMMFYFLLIKNTEKYAQGNFKFTAAHVYCNFPHRSFEGPP